MTFGSFLTILAASALTAVAQVARPVEAQQVIGSMTPERIEEAIQLAADEKAARKFLDVYAVQTHSGWGNGPLIGRFTTPFARVVLAALAARKEDKGFTATDVTPDLIAPELHVIATSQVAFANDTVLAAVQAVFVTPRGGKSPADAVKPVRTTELTKEYATSIGSLADTQGIVAVFPLTVVTIDNDLHVVFDRPARGSSAVATCKDCVMSFPINKIR